MSDPTYTVVAVTARFVIAIDAATGRRDRREITAPVAVEKGDTLTVEQWQSLGSQTEA